VGAYDEPCEYVPEDDRLTKALEEYRCHARDAHDDGEGEEKMVGALRHLYALARVQPPGFTSILAIR
jgi:hypothetical protein